MNYKSILEDLCADFQKRLNIRWPSMKHKVTLESKLEKIPGTKVYRMELSVRQDDIVVYREAYCSRVKKEAKEKEEFLYEKLVKSIFAFGITSSKKYIDDFNIQQRAVRTQNT